MCTYTSVIESGPVSADSSGSVAGGVCVCVEVGVGVAQVLIQSTQVRMPCQHIVIHMQIVQWDTHLEPFH